MVKCRKKDLSGVEHALFNGVNDRIITKTEYRTFLVTLEKKYCKMLSRSDKGRGRARKGEQGFMRNKYQDY